MLLGSRGVRDRRTPADDPGRHPGNASPLYGRHRPEIGVSQRVATVKYIEGQAERHKRISFEEEFGKFLTVHGIEE
jgi:hypothetical protein